MTTPFYTIASSLPRMPTSFKIQATPISRLQLEKRLKLLPLEHLSLLYTLESLVWASWFMPQKPIKEVRSLYQTIQKTNSPFIQDIVNWYMDLRSLFAALRVRKDKKSPPENPQDYWLSSRSKQLIQHWDEPDFGLKAVYPWLPKVAADFAKNDAPAVEEFLLAYIWKHLSRLELGHYFDFEGLVIYLLRWNIIDYWSKFSTSNLVDKVKDLVNSLVSDKHPLEMKGQHHESQ